MTISHDNHQAPQTQNLKAMSAQDFLNFGVHEMVYIKTAIKNDKTVYHVHAADGTLLSTQNNFREANILAHYNNLELVSLH